MTTHDKMSDDEIATVCLDPSDKLPAPLVVNNPELINKAAFVTIPAAVDCFGDVEPVFCKVQGEHKTVEEQGVLREKFTKRAVEIYEKHFMQTKEDVEELKKKYEKPFLGKIKTMEALEKLSLVIDQADTELYCTNQLIHSLQVVNAMEEDGIKDPDLLIAGLLHDIGKLMEINGEHYENIACPNEPIGTYPEGIGLDNIITQFNHDEVGYMKLKEYLPDHVAWLIRYHSLRFRYASPLMDDRDIAYSKRYLQTFRKYDLGTKSMFDIPKKNLYDYEDLILSYLPKYITM